MAPGTSILVGAVRFHNFLPEFPPVSLTKGGIYNHAPHHDLCILYMYVVYWSLELSVDCVYVCVVYVRRRLCVEF